MRSRLRSWKKLLSATALPCPLPLRLIWHCTERGARAFFERWKQIFRWERCAVQEVRADVRATPGRHGCLLEPCNKVSLDLVEGLNSKIRVTQRRVYGYRDKD